MNKFWPSKSSLDAKDFVVLFVSTQYSIVAKGYSLFYYYPNTGKQKYFSKLKDPKNALCAKMRLSRRLLRAEIRCLYHFQNDTWMCIAKKGIFKYHPETRLFEKCCEIEKGSRPMCLCQSNDGTIYYGESVAKIISSAVNKGWQTLYFWLPSKRRTNVLNPSSV